jgi:antirestriction protein ArdC
MIAGYEAWAKMGRQVRKGEKSLKVLAPCIYKVAEDDQSEGKRVLRGFRVASVFDISQTDGPELPTTTPELLDGEAPFGAWDSIVAHVEAAGFTVERGDCGEANGWTNYASRIVRVRADVTDAQALKTLIHEAAHVAMHEHDQTCRGRIEVEAESVAFLVCSALGLATDGYSFPYVAGWSNGQVETVRATADRVIATADAILGAIAAEAEMVAA